MRRLKRPAGTALLATLLLLSACATGRAASLAPAASSAVPTATPTDTALAQHYPRVLVIGGDQAPQTGSQSAPDGLRTQVVAQLQAQDPLSATQSSAVATAPGTRVVDAANQLATMPQADLVLIDLGTADFQSRGHSPTSPTAFGAAYQRIMQQVLATSPGATIVCLTLWNDPENINADLLPADAYDALVAEECHQASASSQVVTVSAVISAARAATPAAGTQSSGFAPDDSNDAIVAHAVVRALEIQVASP